MSFIIRRAEHKDADAIIDSHERSIREVCSKDYTPEQIAAWSGRKHKAELWRNAMDRDFIWIVEINSEVKGFGHLAVMSEDIGEILGFYFSPEVIGLGAGKKLFAVMKDEAQKIGVKELQLHSTVTAKKFYERLGFKQSAGDSTVEMQGVDIPCYPMRFVL